MSTNRAISLFPRVVSRSVVSAVLPALFLFAPGVRAQDPGAEAAAQAMQDTSAPVQLPPARADKPNFYPAPGKFASAVRIAIQDSTPKASIFYTLDGTEPTTSSIPYTGPILVSSTGRIRAMARSPTYSPSKVASAKYVIK